MNVAQNTVLLDGNDNSSRNSGGPLGFQSQVVKPPVDAVGEFKVITNNTSAEFGYRTGAKVLVSTKSGTNEFHGSAYEFLRNQKLDGTNFFANRVGSRKPAFRQNQFGATAGGPVFRNRTFFFFSYQGTRIRLGQSYISSVPSLDVIGGDFSRQPVQRRNIFDPLTLTGTGANATRLPFAGNRIPASRFDPVALNVARLYPAPNIAGREHLPQNFFFSPSDKDGSNQYDMRFDHNLTTRHRMFIRYSIRNQFVDQPGPLPLPANGGTGQTIVLDGDNVTMTLSSTLGAAVHNEARVGWSHFPTRFDIPYTENLNPPLGIKGAPGDSFNDNLDHGFTRFTPTGFTEVGPRCCWPNQNNLDNLHMADNLLIVRGRHGIKIGGEFRRSNVFREAQRLRRGNMAFAGVYTSEKPNDGASRASTGNGLADMLLGWASGGSMGNASGETQINAYHGVYIQDDWKITTRLTINAGLRWELFRAPYFPNPQKQSVVRYLTEINGRSFGQEEFAFPRNGRDCGCKQDWNNFAPRLGLAYRLSEKTVLRVGAGLFYGESDNTQAESSRFVSGAPGFTEISLPQPRETTSLIAQRGFPAFEKRVQPGIGVVTTHDFLPVMYAGQWFVDLQRNLPFDTLLTIGYNGSKATNLATDRNINVPFTPHPTLRWQDRAIRPQWNAVNIREASLNSNYNSLTIKAEKRFTRGFTFLSSFTWSHNINFGNENLEQNGSGRAFEHNLSLDRGNANLDRRLAYSFSTVYELPFGKGKPYWPSGPAAWLFGGWQTGGILSLFSGVPNDHSFNVDRLNLGGRIRGDAIRSPNLARGQRSIDRWFDTGFVVASAPGVLNNAGRNLIIGPGTTNIDFMLARRFDLPWEGHHIQFRFESFNLTNTPNFGTPNTGVGSPAAGLITQADDPRRIQFALKYVW
jgi:hypothetical protein